MPIFGWKIVDIGEKVIPQSIWIILAALLAIMVALIGVPLLVLRKKINEAIAAKFRGREILLTSLKADYKGRSALDDDQPMGRGALVLGEDELWFLLPHPIHQLSIPAENISAVSLTDTHRDKTHRTQLLRVEFRTKDGTDSAAWRVKQPEEWKSKIDGIIAHTD